MNLRTKFSALLLAAAASVAAPHAARGAGDEEDPATRDAKARIEYFDKMAGKVRDDGKYAELLMDLASFPHELTVERVGKVLFRDRDEEHQAIAASALAEFTKPQAVREAAGKVLVKAISGEDVNDYVKDSCIDAIGKLPYRDAVPALNAVALQGGDPYVLLTTVRVMGELKDRRALSALLQLWERMPKGYKWDTGGEEKVDTGSAGTADAEAAKAKWEAKNKGKGRKGKPPVMLRQYVQELVKSVKILTRDDTIETSDQLRAWMEARREELAKEGVEIPKATGPAQKPDSEKEKDKEKGKDKAKGDDKAGDGKDKDGK